MKRVIGSVCVLVLAILGFAACGGGEPSYTEVKEEEVAATLAEVADLVNQNENIRFADGWEIVGETNLRQEFTVENTTALSLMQLKYRLFGKMGADQNPQILLRASGKVGFGATEEEIETEDLQIYIAGGVRYEDDGKDRIRRAFTEKDEEELMEMMMRTSFLGELDFSDTERFQKIEVSGKEGKERFYRLTMDIKDWLLAGSGIEAEHLNGAFLYTITYQFDAKNRLTGLESKIQQTGNFAETEEVSGQTMEGKLDCSISFTMKPFSGDIEEPADLDQYVEESLAA